MSKELFNKTPLITTIPDTHRIASGIPGLVWCENTLFSDVKQNIRPYDTDTFENSDLNGSYELLINHARNTTLVRATLYNPSGVEEYTAGIFSITDADNVKFSFGGAIQAGTWTYILEYY